MAGKGSPGPTHGRPQKVVGIGLNKTGTKTLRHYLQQWGYVHHTFDEDAFALYRRGDIEALLGLMEGYDSFEDWPWPLFFKRIDERFPDARFLLTVRKDPDTWYRSLCHMAVRMGPLDTYEKHIYGHGMPQGHRKEHIAFYEAHNQAVRNHFKDRPGKLLEICWEHDRSPEPLAEFLGEPMPEGQPVHVNRSQRFVYRGDNRLIAEVNRVGYQSVQRVRTLGTRVVKGVRRRLP